MKDQSSLLGDCNSHMSLPTEVSLNIYAQVAADGSDMISVNTNNFTAKYYLNYYTTRNQFSYP